MQDLMGNLTKKRTYEVQYKRNTMFSPTTRKWNINMKFYPMCVNASLYPPKLIYVNVIAKSQGGSSENTLLSACCEISSSTE